MRNKPIHITDWRRFPLGSHKELRKLEKKVEMLEAKVKQLEKRTNDSTASRVVGWILAILEIAVAILTIIGLVS